MVLLSNCGWRVLFHLNRFIVYSTNGIFVHMPNQYINNAHIVVAYIMATFCFWVYYKACSVSPGQITEASSVELVKKYKPYCDGLLYK